LLSSLLAGTATPDVRWSLTLNAEAKNGTGRQLFHPHDDDDDDASSFDKYEQKEPETLHMSVYSPTALNTVLRGSQPSRRHRELEETYFQIKLYHEPGYCWQSEWEDRVWCAECTNECEEWDYLEIQRCDSAENKQYFTYEAMPNSVGGRIKPMTNLSLCWERTRVNANQLKPCDDIDRVVNVTQIFRDFDYILTSSNCIHSIEETIPLIPTVPCAFPIIIIPKGKKLFVPRIVAVHENSSPVFGLSAMHIRKETQIPPMKKQML
jgi:hypothetical protein